MDGEKKYRTREIKQKQLKNTAGTKTGNVFFFFFFFFFFLDVEDENFFFLKYKDHVEYKYKYEQGDDRAK